MDFGKLCCGDCGRKAVSGEAAWSPHHNPVRNILSQMLRATFAIQRQVIAAMKSGMRALLTIVAVEDAKVFEH